MAISDAEYNSWLSSPSAFRCILVEANVNVSGSETTRYLSNRGYVTEASESPANTAYRALIIGGVKLSETLSLETNGTLSYGEIELDNTDATLDSWLEDVWENRGVSVFFGDSRWARSDFRLVFKGMLGGISSQRRERLNLFLRDSLQRLNTPITDSKLGGTTPNKDKLIPLTFGECHKVSPQLTDAATSSLLSTSSLCSTISFLSINLGVPLGGKSIRRSCSSPVLDIVTCAPTLPASC